MQDMLARRMGRIALARLLLSGLQHELRQPLNACSLFLDAAGQHLAGTAGARAVASAAAELQRLATQLNHQRQLCAPLPLQRRSFAVGDALAARRDDWAPRLQAAGIRLCLAAAPASLAVTADPLLLGLALDELLDNAAAALADGAVRSPAIELAAGGDAAQGVWIEIADNGPGLAPAVREQPFAPLAHARPGHLGVGLALARWLLEQQGGGIELVPEVGARLRLSLPGG